MRDEMEARKKHLPADSREAVNRPAESQEEIAERAVASEVIRQR